MYLDLLKKDLRRKRTMNIILLLFVTLASMFVSSSVNNIVTVSSALDYFFEQSQMADYYLCVKSTGETRPDLTEFLDGLEYADHYKQEPVIVCLVPEQITHGDEPINVASTPMLSAFEHSTIRFFLEDNTPLTAVAPGQVYLSRKTLESNGLELGDRITFTFGSAQVELTIAGRIKDAFLGSEMISMNRFLMSAQDFDLLYDQPEAVPYTCSLALLYSDQLPLLEREVAQTLENAVFTTNDSNLRTMYIMDMLVAGILLVFSVFIILIAFVVLRFTIHFTLEEEFREIGVMKAIGIRNMKIRGLYLVKYLSLAVLGSVIGFFAGVPFGELLLDSVSQNIVIPAGSRWLLNAAAAALVALLVVLFSFRCTGKIKRATPLDAIRSGENGERYGRKGVLALSRSKLPPCGFLALNDILSGFKRFGVMLAAFALSLLLIAIVANTANTLRDDGLVTWFGMQRTHLYLIDDDVAQFFTHDGQTNVRNYLRQLEDTLAEHDMPGTATMEAMLKLPVSKGENSCQSVVFYGVGTDAAGYDYLEGTPPQNAGEIAITPIIAATLDAAIGDTVTLTYLDGPKDYLITALFQSMSNMGEGVRLHQDADPDFAQLMGLYSFQVQFDDQPDSKTLDQRADVLRDLYPDLTVKRGGQYIDDMIGNIASILDSVKLLIITIVLMISALIVVLMERSFISREKNEIALLKAMGFRSRTVIRWHTLRLAVVMVLAAAVNAALSVPLSHVVVEPLFKMMGAQTIQLVIHPVEAFVLYPLLLGAFVLIATWLTAQYTRRINASDTSNIE